MPTASIRTRPPRIVQSRQNARVKELRAGFKQSSRTEQGRIAIEGEHLLLEAVASRLSISTVFVRAGSEHLLSHLRLPESAEILALPREVFSSAVDTESPQGIAALVEPPDFTLDRIFAGSSAPLIVIAAGLQDPGNLGTLIRSAEAFGAAGLINLPGTVSPWNQKALRASAGSSFRLPVISVREDEALAALASRDISVFAAVASGGESVTTLDLTRPAALIIGNEGSGLPHKILSSATATVTIPVPGSVESLNAAIAGSILLYEASRQRAGNP
ncbi:MAG: RNA methyltransferase [Acidobacteriaceae bacterium]|nr:RNA methyltransferase [Acidobacteriaceae bacterium]